MSVSEMTAAPTVPELSRRDLAVDGVRVLCVLVVVVAHLLMVGVGVDASGGLAITKPVTEQAWFPLATVVGEVMPLFFALGGFAAATGWRSLRARGGGYAEFLHARLLRLVRPTVPVFAFFTVVIVGALLAGLPAEVVGAVAAGVGTPLWFLAAFVLCQWAAPAMIALHERWRWGTFGGLAAAAMTVDAVRTATGLAEVGLLNTVFVWLFAQQLGFFLADGTLLAARRATLVAAAALAGLALALGVASGLYSPDMLTNQYPPLFALGLLGVAQVCALGLLHPALTLLMRTRPARVVTFAVGSRLMTVYLWHLTAIIAVTGVCLLVPGWTVAPGSSTWWETRPLVLVAALAVVFLVSLVVVRFERGTVRMQPGQLRPQLWRLHLAAALVFVPAFVIMVRGLDGVLAAAALAASLLAVRLCRPRPTIAPGVLHATRRAQA